MTDSLVWPALAAILVLAEFFGALACYALRGFSRSRLDEVCRQNGRPERFGVILRRAEPTLLALELWWLVGLAILVAAVLATCQAWQLPDSAAGWTAYSARLLGALAGLAALCVVVPWSIARVAGEPFLFRAWPLLCALRALTTPLLRLSDRFDRFTHRVSGVAEPAAGDAAVITEEILTVVDEGQREGVLEQDAGTMIHRVMEMAREDVAAIMTPRTDMVSLHVDSSLEDARQLLLEAGHSRLPVIGASTDDVIGVLYAKDLLKHLDAVNGQAIRLRDIVREPFYVPETTRIDSLLEAMKRKRVQMAIVLDEYGGVAGLVTMEDILEEIVGEIVDEYDTAEEEEGIRQVGPGVHEVDARVHIDDLNEQFDFNLPEDGDFETIGGFTFTQFGRVPQPQESFTYGQLRITVLEADKRKINKLRIEVDPALAAATAEER